jgi:[acyl-carrier-protein] S-malonyltransferase
MRVLMFPGQSSADPRMLARASSMHPATKSVIDRAAAVLHEQIRHYMSPDGVPLATNRDVQVSVFLVTQMHLAALAAEGIDGECSLGLSLGEYSHLVHIGALSFEDALRLVDARGAAYDMSPLGIMAVVLAVDGQAVEAVVQEASVHGIIVVSNYNAPTQHVIAGEAAAVMWASARLEEEHLAHTVIIERRVPMHTPLLGQVASGFAADLERAPWRLPTPAAPAAGRYLPNVLGRWVPNAQPSDFVKHLTAHVTQPVRWRESIEMLAEANPGATFVEVGPGAVLRNMFGRRWLRLASAGTDAPTGTDPAEYFRATVGALRAD